MIPFQDFVSCPCEKLEWISDVCLYPQGCARNPSGLLDFTLYPHSTIQFHYKQDLLPQSKGIFASFVGGAVRMKLREEPSLKTAGFRQIRIMTMCEGLCPLNAMEEPVKPEKLRMDQGWMSHRSQNKHI